MGFSLFPKEVKFFDLFRQQNKLLRKAAKGLHELFEDFDHVEDRIKRINQIEEEADAISRVIANELSTTFITPLDREDIHAINVTQETIINLIKAIATRIGLYDFTSIRYPSKRLAKNLKSMTKRTGEILELICKGKKADAEIAKLMDLKRNCEMLLLVGLGEIYDSHQDDPLFVLEALKWTHIYDRIEQATVRTENLCHVLEGIILKHA